MRFQKSVFTVSVLTGICVAAGCGSQTENISVTGGLEAQHTQGWGREGHSFEGWDSQGSHFEWAPQRVAPVERAAPMYKMLAGMEGRAGDPEMENRFIVLLRQLDEKYEEPNPAIAGITRNSHYELKQKGVSVSVLTIMEGMNQIAPPGQKGLKYLEFSGLYITSRTKGSPHQQAIADVRTKIPAIAER